MVRALHPTVDEKLMWTAVPALSAFMSSLRILALITNGRLQFSKAVLFDTYGFFAHILPFICPLPFGIGCKILRYRRDIETYQILI
jgi:hypothetical protein